MSAPKGKKHKGNGTHGHAHGGSGSHQHAHEVLQGHGHGAHHAHDGHHHEEPMTPDEAVKSLLVLGQVALASNDCESAAEAYASALKIESNEVALYNLANLYARGAGVRQDFVEAARLFHKAEFWGNKRAGELCAKCMLDYIHKDFDAKKASDIYAAMAVFVSQVYPEAMDQQQEVVRGLFAIGNTHFSKGEYADAARVFRAGAEFGHDGYAQYYLATLYHAGAGVDQNDLAALYWFDCATDNGAAAIAIADRDHLLNNYRQGLTASDFHDMMVALADCCETGTPDIPVDPDKAAQWRAFA